MFSEDKPTLSINKLFPLHPVDKSNELEWLKD